MKDSEYNPEKQHDNWNTLKYLLHKIVILNVLQMCYVKLYYYRSSFKCLQNSKIDLLNEKIDTGIFHLHAIGMATEVWHS